MGGMFAGRLAQMLVRLAARGVPHTERDRFLAEWEGELAGEAERTGAWSSVGAAMGAFADARTLRALRRAGREADGNQGRGSMGEWIDEALRNIRFTLRGMRRSPLFFVTSVVTLALCVGLGAATWSVVDGALWRSLPYPAPDQLASVVLYPPSQGKPTGYVAVDGQTWERIRDQGPPFKRAVYSDWVRGVNLSTEESAAFVQQQRVGAGYFDVLGVSPLLGREFDEAEDVPDGAAVAILSHGLWSRTFGADPAIVGKTIRLKGEAHTVVGVMPEGFTTPGQDADLWTPLRASTRGEGGGANYGVLARIPGGMSFEEADARMASIEAPPRDGPERVFGLMPLNETLSAGVRMPMYILLGAIGLMLVVGCANLAGLQIARSLARQSEMATRQALGGGTGVLARQIATENLLLGALGGTAGIGVAYLILGALSGKIEWLLWQDVGMNRVALLAALALTVVTTFLFGLAPVLQVRNPAVSRLLVSGGRGAVGGGAHALRKILLVAQVAMVTALLFAAGLLVRSYGHLQGLEPGFNPTNVLAVQYSLDDARYADAENVHRLFAETLQGIRRIPGVTAAAVSLTLPYERPLNVWCRVPGDAEDDGHVSNAVYVTPGFFRTMEIPLLQGRVFEEADRVGAAGGLVVNQAFVESYLQGTEPLGARVSRCMGGQDGLEIIGVVGNVQQNGQWGVTDQPVWETPTLYYAAAQVDGEGFQQAHVWFSPNWIVRATPGAAPTLAGEVTQVFRGVDPDLPTARVAWLSDIMEEAFASSRFEAYALLAVAMFALLLAGVGLYGIIAHEVVQRRSEMGLRMALGATTGSAVRAAAMPGIRLTLIGFLIGGVLAWAESRVMVHLIWGVTPGDPITLLGLVVVLGLLASVASFLPAARLGRLDPAVVLRDG